MRAVKMAPDPERQEYVNVHFARAMEPTLSA